MVIVRSIKKLNAALQNPGHSLAPGLAFLYLFVYFILCWAKQISLIHLHYHAKRQRSIISVWAVFFTMILQGQLSWYLYKSLLNYVHSWTQHYLDSHVCRLYFIHCHSPVHKHRCFIS